MSGPWNPGLILGVCFGIGAAVTFALSFRIKPDSWWREMVGLDDESVKSIGVRTRR